MTIAESKQLFDGLDAFASVCISSSAVVTLSRTQQRFDSVFIELKRRQLCMFIIARLWEEEFLFFFFDFIPCQLNQETQTHTHTQKERERAQT